MLNFFGKTHSNIVDILKAIIMTCVFNHKFFVNFNLFKCFEFEGWRNAKNHSQISFELVPLSYQVENTNCIYKLY